MSVSYSNSSERLWELFQTLEGSVVLPPESSAVLASGNINVENATLVMRVLTKAATVCKTGADFHNVLVTGNLPAVKLTSREMEFVSGGAFQSTTQALIQETSLNPEKAASSCTDCGSCHGRSNLAPTK